MNYKIVYDPCTETYTGYRRERNGFGWVQIYPPTKKKIATREHAVNFLLWYKRKHCKTCNPPLPYPPSTEYFN